MLKVLICDIDRVKEVFVPLESGTSLFGDNEWDDLFRFSEYDISLREPSALHLCGGHCEAVVVFFEGRDPSLRKTDECKCLHLSFPANRKFNLNFLSGRLNVLYNAEHQIVRFLELQKNFVSVSLKMFEKVFLLPCSLPFPRN